MVRPQREFLLIKLEGIDEISQAQSVRGQEIFLPEKDLDALESGQFYHYQLIGCRVETKKSKRVGIVKDIWQIQNNPQLVVEKRKTEIYIPFTQQICTEINLEKKEIVVDPPEGLLELNEI